MPRNWEGSTVRGKQNVSERGYCVPYTCIHAVGVTF
jgi:hypothetical protein